MRKVILVLFSLIVMLCLVSCERNWENSPPPLRVYILIIKFKQPEYKDYIMSHFSTKADCDLGPAIYPRFLPPSVLNLYGQSPYIELADGYLLFDWKWEQAYYYGAIINEKWTELTTRNICWPIEKLYVARPVAEIYNISADKIKEYNSGYLEHDTSVSYLVFPYSEQRWKNLKKQEKKRVLSQTKEIDEAFIEYAEVLSRMINEGKLDEYGTKYSFENN